MWDTTVCPPAAPEGSCDGAIRGATGVLPNSGWQRTSGSTLCNAEFLTDPGGGRPIQHTLNFLVNIQDDNVKADRQNYLIVHMHSTSQVLRLPILDND